MADNSTKRQLHDIQEQPPTDVTPRIHYEVFEKKPTWNDIFESLLSYLFTSTQQDFGTKNIVNDIPNNFDPQVQTFPILEILEALSNHTDIETLFELRLTYFDRGWILN